MLESKIKEKWLQQVQLDKAVAAAHYDEWSYWIDRIFLLPKYEACVWSWVKNTDESEFEEFIDFIDGNGFSVRVCESSTIGVYIVTVYRIFDK